MFAMVYYAMHVLIFWSLWPKFCKVQMVYISREKKKKVFQRFVQKDIRDKRGKEYVQRILLYVGGGVEEKVLTLMKASLKMLEPFLVSIKINEQTSVDSHVRRVVCIFQEVIEVCHCAANESHQDHLCEKYCLYKK